MNLTRRIGINFHSKTTFISGVQHYALGLIKALLMTDPATQYIVFTNHPHLVREYVGAFPNLAVRATSIKTRVHRIVWEHFRLPQLAVREKLDLLHCPCYICPLFDGGTPYVVTLHDTIALDHPEWCTSCNALYYGAFMKASVRKAAAVIAVSHTAASDVQRHFPEHGQKVRIVYPGIDAAFLAPADPAHLQAVKLRYGLPDRYILHVGNLEPRKNLSTLLEAMTILKERGFPHTLVLAGRATRRSHRSIREAESEQRAGNVILTGYVERRDLPCIYRLADVFVFASLYEGFGFPPLEAMVSETPVVASTRGALGETLDYAATVSDPSNPQEIADVIACTLRNPPTEETRAWIRQSMATRFDWERAARETRDVYDSVLSGRMSDS